MLQADCDRLTQAVLWRRMRQTEKPQLYLCQVKCRDETGWVVISHDWPIQRMVICGGNAGFSNPGVFEGNPKGADLGFRVHKFINVEQIDLDAIVLAP